MLIITNDGCYAFAIMEEPASMRGLPRTLAAILGGFFYHFESPF
jgi:hypothetical protein